MAAKAAREGQLRAEELRLLRAEVEQVRRTILLLSFFFDIVVLVHVVVVFWFVFIYSFLFSHVLVS